jgi:hypothetical protein
MTEEVTEQTIETISRRLHNLEKHVINLIIPIQGICKVLSCPNDIKYLIESLNKPIPINDTSLRILLADFDREMKRFYKSIEELKSLNVSQTYAEIKYIGKRLNEIELILECMKKEGIKKDIHLDFTVDGYQMVKRPVGYDPEDPIEKPDTSLQDLLNSLDKREAKAIIHRLGLFGEKKKTYEKLGNVFGVAGEQARRIYARAIRKCRHPERKELVDKITQPDLRKEIFGLP